MNYESRWPMGKHPSKVLIGVVSPVTRVSVPSLQVFEIAEFTADELNAAELLRRNLSILIVSGDFHPLKSVLPALRASMPNLPVVALSGSLDRPSTYFFRNHVDGLYELPKDSEKLAAAAMLETDMRPHGWRSFIWEKIANQLLAMTALLVLWWSLVAVLKPAPYLFPSPERVATALVLHIDQFALHLSVTAYEAFLGFVIGNTLGMAIAVVLHRYVSLQKFTLPVLISFQAIPIVALAPLLVVWMGSGLPSKVAMAAIICFFPMVVNGLQAFSGIDRDYVELFDFYRASFMAKLRLLLLPASFPALVAALRISAGLAVVGAIVAELTGADKGLGYVLLNASYRLETDMLFVAMLLSGGLGMAFFQIPSVLRFVVPRSWRIALT